MSDVLMHIKYTAREAGDPLRTAAATELRQSTLAAIARAENATGLARLFGLRHEFPDAWFRMFTPTAIATEPQQLELLLSVDRFPFIVRGAKLSFSRVEVFIRIAPAFATTTHAADKLVVSISRSRRPGHRHRV